MARIFDEEVKPVSGNPEAPKQIKAGSSTSKGLKLSDWDAFEREPDAEEKDSLYVPKGIIPDGMDVNWKRFSVYGKEDKQHSAELKRKGWRPVPADMDGFKEYFQAFVDEAHGIIENAGCVLMIRPKKYSDQAKNEQVKRAKDSVNQKMEEMGMTTNKAMPRNVHAMERSYESNSSIAVPD